MYGFARVNRGTQFDNCWRVAFYKEGNKWMTAAVLKDGGIWGLVKIPLKTKTMPLDGDPAKQAKKVLRRMKRKLFSKGAWSLINEVANNA